MYVQRKPLVELQTFNQINSNCNVGTEEIVSFIRKNLEIAQQPYLFVCILTHLKHKDGNKG